MTAGSPCGTTFDDVTPLQMRQFWSAVEGIFSGMLFDSRSSSMNTTTVNQLLAMGQRVVIYTSPGNFSGGSPHALDGCTIDNQVRAFLRSPLL